MINWKVRLKNPTFWVGLIGILGTLVIDVAQLFGADLSAIVGNWETALTGLAAGRVLPSSPSSA